MQDLPKFPPVWWIQSCYISPGPGCLSTCLYKNKCATCQRTKIVAAVKEKKKKKTHIWLKLNIYCPSLYFIMEHIEEYVECILFWLYSPLFQQEVLKCATAYVFCLDEKMPTFIFTCTASIGRLQTHTEPQYMCEMVLFLIPQPDQQF